MARVEIVHPFIMKIGFVQGEFRTPDGIARMVLGVWVLPLRSNFNFVPSP